MSTLLRCLFGPRLYHIYQRGNSAGRPFDANIVEKCGDAVIKMFRFCCSVSWWTSPVLFIIMYNRGAFTYEGMLTLSSYSLSLVAVLFVSIFVRALGRLSNWEYREFLSVLRNSQRLMDLESRTKLSVYDFDFSAWPVEFIANSSRPKIQLSRQFHPRRTTAERMKTVPCQILSFVAIHTFGRRFVYPGSVSLLHALVSPMLLQGRIKLIEEKKGRRTKLLTTDQNEIDTMFVDRRNSPEYPKGKTLVICCEGNAGFYEIGCTVTPLEAGYSVLGWNHPGFGGSTGAPFPDQEQHAIDAVIQFAIHKLGFPVYDIMLFAWSIGGYSATWAAMNYPDINSVVLDATFDDILPLAIARMPQSWDSLVRLTIKKYMNLNNAEQLCKYPGPVLIIRRTRDEMITTIDPTIKSSNRGNFLLIKLLSFRYPNVFCDDTLSMVLDWFSKDSASQVSLWTNYEVDEEWCLSIIQSFMEENSAAFPMFLGEHFPLLARKQLALFLLNKHMDEFEATHCHPLPGSYIRKPWSITTDAVLPDLSKI